MQILYTRDTASSQFLPPWSDKQDESSDAAVERFVKAKSAFYIGRASLGQHATIASHYFPSGPRESAHSSANEIVVKARLGRASVVGGSALPDAAAQPRHFVAVAVPEGVSALPGGRPLPRFGA